MPALRSQTVNYCQPDAVFWQTDAPEAALHSPGLRRGSPLTLTLTGPGAWKSVPRHAEPERPYELECAVRGRGRIGLVFVREGRPVQGVAPAADRQVWTSPEGTPRFAQLSEIEVVWSKEFDAAKWRRVTIKGVSPVTANRVMAVFESIGENEAAFDSPHLDGLGAVPVEVIVPAGYHPNSTKVAVVTTRERATGGRFEVVSDGRVVGSGALARWGEYLWGREYWQADFTSLAMPACYQVRVRFDHGSTAESPEFCVDPDLYLSLPNLTLGWYYTQRCGMEVPGWHPACHLDDALLGKSPKRRLGPGGHPWEITGEADLVGGWHDAGDNHKYICWSYLALWGLSRLQEIEPSERRELGEALPDPLAEAAWEGRFLLKSMSPEGLFPLGVVSRYGWVNGPIHEETDNVRGTGDERGLPDPHERIYDIPTYGPELTSALVASSLADLSRGVRGYDDALAAALLRAARTTWQLHGGEPPDAEYLRWHASFALLAAALHRCEPSDALRTDLEAHVARIIAQQTEEGTFPFAKHHDDYRALTLKTPVEERAKLPDLSPVRAGYTISQEVAGVDYIPNPFMYLHALLDYVELFPEGRHAPAAKQALSRAFDLAQSLTARTPFGHMMEWTFAPDPVNFVHLFHGYTCALLSLATAGCRAAGLLDRPELLALAERQVQWVLGRNPRATSLVCGVGAKQLGIYHTGLCHYEGHRTGEQLGGVVNGFVSMGAPRLTYSGPTYPWDFPYLDIRSASEEAGWIGIDGDWWTNETWVPNCSWFILATVALHRALGEKEGGGTASRQV